MDAAGGEYIECYRRDADNAGTYTTPPGRRQPPSHLLTTYSSDSSPPPAAGRRLTSPATTRGSIPGRGCCDRCARRRLTHNRAFTSVFPRRGSRARPLGLTLRGLNLQPGHDERETKLYDCSRISISKARAHALLRTRPRHASPHVFCWSLLTPTPRFPRASSFFSSDAPPDVRPLGEAARARPRDAARGRCGVRAGVHLPPHHQDPPHPRPRPARVGVRSVRARRGHRRPERHQARAGARDARRRLREQREGRHRGRHQGRRLRGVRRGERGPAWEPGGPEAVEPVEPAQGEDVDHLRAAAAPAVARELAGSGNGGQPHPATRASCLQAPFTAAAALSCSLSHTGQW